MLWNIVYAKLTRKILLQSTPLINGRLRRQRYITIVSTTKNNTLKTAVNQNVWNWQQMILHCTCTKHHNAQKGFPTPHEPDRAALRRYEHITPVVCELHWLPLHNVARWLSLSGVALQEPVYLAEHYCLAN